MLDVVRRDYSAAPRGPDPLLPHSPSEATPEMTAVSRVLSKVLRHEPSLIGVRPDMQGWVRLDSLLAGFAAARTRPGAAKRLRTLPHVSAAFIEAVVRTSPKQRFELSADRSRIRAVQGHSIEVELAHPVVAPPAMLFHGTAHSSVEAILREGLVSRARHAVHLSADRETARAVGARHGSPTVLVIAAGQMHADGFRFALAPNGVWLVEAVPARYVRHT